MRVGNSRVVALHTPRVVNQKQRPELHDSHIDYRWPVDRHSGFEKTTLIYDAQGRLIAIDVMPAPQRRAGSSAPEPEAG